MVTSFSTSVKRWKLGFAVYLLCGAQKDTKSVPQRSGWVAVLHYKETFIQFYVPTYSDKVFPGKDSAA